MWAHEGDARRLALLERRGYRPQRAFLRLERDLDDSFEPPGWPAGIRVAAFRPAWTTPRCTPPTRTRSPTTTGPASSTWSEWLQSRFAHGGPDLGLWLVAWDGAEAVGGIEATETPAGALHG